jgi:transposase
VSIVMGLDQHRAQITAEWLDTSSGELSRTRIAPADRAGVRRFAARFRGEEVEVALEATTGWRFVVEELQAVGARVRLAEPAETARRGTKKRAKSDRADARHLRELLMVRRLPESWIPPEHLLDLRARVRLRHTLVDQRREWQQRMQATLYHHGAPPRSWLMSAASRAWLAGLALPAAAREAITVALAMIDAHDAQLVPLDHELRDYARRQPGCRALMRHYGIGPLTAVTILAELGDARRFSSSREAVRYAGMDITVHQSDTRRAAGPALAPRAPSVALGSLRGRSVRPPTQLARPRLLPRDRGPAWRQPRLPRGRAQTAQAQLPHPARARRGGPAARMTAALRALPFITPMHRGQLPACSCRHTHVDGLHRQSGRTASPKRNTPSTIMSPGPARIADRDKAGRPRAPPHPPTRTRPTAAAP